MSELEAAGMVDFELAGLTEFDTGAAAGEGFAAGAEAVVLAAGAGAGAAAGALLALVSSAVFFLCDFLVVLAVVSLAAGWLPVAVLLPALLSLLALALLSDVAPALVLAALVSSAVFFLWDFLVVLVDVSFVAAVCELDADLSSVAAVSFFDFLDFFFVVVSLLVVLSVELAWAATIDGINVRISAKQSAPDNKLNLFHEFMFLALQE
jgi:hypothetical protein